MSNKFKIDDIVWVVSNTGKIYAGVIKEITSSFREGVVVTVLTDTFGFRSVPIENCSYTNPKGQSLFAKQLAN